MKTVKQKNSNTFQTIVRTVVREEVKSEVEKVEKRLDDKWDLRFSAFEERMDEKLENTFKKFRDEIMTAIDQLTGMFKKHFEEHEILNGQHKRINDLEDKVEVLETIHPQGQHVLA